VCGGNIHALTSALGSGKVAASRSGPFTPSERYTDTNCKGYGPASRIYTSMPGLSAVTVKKLKTDRNINFKLLLLLLFSHPHFCKNNEKKAKYGILETLGTCFCWQF
jgi:hypothetical protein